MKKITFGLVCFGILLGFESNGKNSEFSSTDHYSESTEFSNNLEEFQKTKEEKKLQSYYKNQSSLETFEKKLSGFNKALQNPKTRFNVILNRGSKIFDSEANKKLFNPNQKISPNLKKLFKQIYDARYPEALSAWSEIKYMESTDPEQHKKLNNFKEKIRLLLRDVQDLKTYSKSYNNSSKKERNPVD